MNAVEIEEAVSTLAEQPFDGESFPLAFLEAFGNKDTTIRRLKSGTSNQSNLPGGILQRNNIHIQVCPEGAVPATLTALRESPATTKQKAKFILATDGKTFEAENLADGETVACDYAQFSDHFGFFLALAGITTVKQIRENAFDIKATGRLNRLYIELLKENPAWGTASRREDLNHFMARLIFCFFAEDTDIFNGQGLFTATIEQMSTRDSSNTHEVLSELFRAMNTRPVDRAASNIRSWADGFPYVNGGLFSGGADVPRFSRIARSYLLHVGSLDWTKINPDIFGSMIQAVADDEERGALGMHYTSVPNILKVLNPLFLDDLRAQLEEAGDNGRKLLNLRQRIARIRVFDPACGSGNFLVIAYKQMREIEAEINDKKRILRTIQNLQPRGSTALYDAVLLGLQKITDGKHRKRALLLLTDGNDTNSSVKFEDIVALARKSEVVIYGLGIGHGEKGSVHSGIFDSQVKDTVDMKTLRALADATGGNAYYLENAHEGGRDRVDEASAEVAAELKQQYTLGYYPTNQKKDGGFRQIVVELKDKSLRVRTKRGYYAPNKI